MPSIDIFLLRHPEVSHRSKRSAKGPLDLLRSHPKILYAQQEQILVREKRTSSHENTGPRSSNRLHFVDPHFKDQWYLRGDSGTANNDKVLDLNVDPVWSSGFTGKGVVVCVIDDGIYYNHPDLTRNFKLEYSKDLNDPSKGNDPMPDLSNRENSHGTQCAGEIAAEANNSVCGIGIAFDSSIGGIRILDGDITDTMEAEALNFRMNDIHIYSASWGPPDDGTVFSGPGYLAAEALERGVERGRGGLGSIYVWATGNGGAFDDDCGADGYVSSIETISIGSVNQQGRMPYFSEECASTITVVPTGGVEHLENDIAENKTKIVTTDLHDECILDFEGTSSAAPLAAGCIALALQSNNELTWRDVQHLVVHSARIPSVDDSWAINGAGFHFSHKFGFGMLDCGRLVQLAQSWKTESPQRKCVLRTRIVNSQIRSMRMVTDKISTDACRGTSNQIDHLEHVQIKLKLWHSRRGNLQVRLISPAGTTSELLSTRFRDEDNVEGIDHTFMSVHFWLENATGTWQLQVSDTLIAYWSLELGVLQEWTLILYGISGSPVNAIQTTARKLSYAYLPTNLNELSEEERLRSHNVTIRSLDSKQNKELKKRDITIAKSRRQNGIDNKELKVTSDFVEQGSDGKLMHSKQTAKSPFKEKKDEGTSDVKVYNSNVRENQQRTGIDECNLGLDRLR